MLGPLSPPHSSAVSSLILQGERDCLLVSSCGVPVAVQSLLLALHSPILASLLGEVGHGERGVSLPLSLSQVRGLVELLQGQGRPAGREEVEAAQLLGLGLSVDMDISMETSGNDEEDKQLLKYKRKVKQAQKEKCETVEKEAILVVTPEQEGTSQETTELLRMVDSEDLDKTEDTSWLELTNLADSSDDGEDSDVGSKVKCKEVETKMKKKNNKSNGRRFKNGRPKKSLKNKGFPCEYCIDSFKTSNFLMRHILSEHDKPIKCDKCDVTFSEIIPFKNHIKKIHSIHICNICGISKSKKTQLDYHMEAEHQKNVTCPACMITCKTQTLLRYHILRIHSRKLFQKCTKCDYKSHIPSEMKGHFKRRHTDITKGTCQYCGVVFKALKSHLRNTGCGGEVNITKLKCTHCKTYFKVKSELDRHVNRIHKNIKDNKCQDCSYATYSGYNLKLHITKMHLGKKIEKQICPYCNKETTNINYHIDTMHNEHFIAEKTDGKIKPRGRPSSYIMSQDSSD